MYPVIWKLTTKKHIFLVLLATALLSYFNNGLAQPCDTCRVNVLFKGEYVDATCNISVNSGNNSGTITMPTLSTNRLSHDGVEAGGTQFSIALKDCPPDRIVTVRFISNISLPDNETGNLQNDAGSENSRNVQIRIRKENGSQIKIDDTDSGQDYQIPSSSEEIKHFYTASYYAKGNSAVTSGLVKSTAGIDLIYK
ncbi:fimbrial protein [Rouxiella sp. Mn2063]|uniref:fimbrial protein n=1 Tax=Rouxiella sp. Mn2063 TaxID=3395262 RepID=UPI003BDD5AEA